MNSPDPFDSPGDDRELRQWATILHLSLLAGLIVPVGGLIAPIIIYILKKDDVPGLQAHGHVVFNWMISALIYGVISVILMLVLIGFVMIWLLALLALIFPIIGAIKANDGELWPYPLSIQFLGRT